MCVVAGWIVSARVARRYGIEGGSGHRSDAYDVGVSEVLTALGNYVAGTSPRFSRAPRSVVCYTLAWRGPGGVEFAEHGANGGNVLAALKREVLQKMSCAIAGLHFSDPP